MRIQAAYLSFSDNEILSEIIANSRFDLFDILYKRYSKKVYATCFRMLKNEMLAADLSQDIFMKVFSKLKSFKKQSSFSTWLYSITYNECVDHLRKNKKKHLNYSIDDAINNYLLEKLEEDDICEDALEIIDIDKVKNLMQEIPSHDKELLLMKYDLRLTIKEISAQTDLSESAVKMRLKRAKTKLTRLYFIS